MSQENNQNLIPQAYLTNFYNRIRKEDVPMFITVQPTRGHKRAKVVNYAEYDNDLFDEGNNNILDINTDMMNNLHESQSGDHLNDNDNNTEFDGSSNLDGTPNDGTYNLQQQQQQQQHQQHQQQHQHPNDRLLLNELPDLQEQEDQFSVLKYPKIRATFLQSKIATPYRISIPTQTLLPSSSEQKSIGPIIIPIHLNIEHAGHVIKDSFTWNINDHSISPAEFATIYCKDLDSPSNSSLHSTIVQSINDQINEWETIAATKIMTDLHVIINLTCNLENKFFEDNFQWNLNDDSMTPELFASIVVNDLGLTREFIPTISIALHEYILKIKKEWLEQQQQQQTTSSSTPIASQPNMASQLQLQIQLQNVQNYAAFGQLSGIRLDINSDYDYTSSISNLTSDLGIAWCPRLEELSTEEIQRREIEKERNLRRLKRETERIQRRGRRRLDELL
ncbi:Sfh1p NDAI_0J01760 [Naumovozyma dairenensis CBS 421]|uniref:Chromatin structure-remodeling complex subunit SFH1 n=1 Tax=Naumovozyma dairenensis (strain ATCC 10597 / BCRC 20456 / CBS 421 / NBRC 0211 / NRRL Y-12639) TaxID=1071378 RepID=G0WGZ0_NAUDC|nr:hypothetical protein NDAI_0J01760 [Naumovozyma dairenensis CBS 421]CCD27068.1 hypothetical protein NDAI_0J01760 [Naumovozyma dairenensis CBS 421]